MTKKYLFKDTFAVIGKAGQGSSENPQGWILPLWDEANAHFGEIAELVHKNESGIPSIWGAMNDADEQNKRWDNTGKYMPGGETDVDATAPEGWTKWIIPAQTYMVISCTMDEYGDVFGKITNDPDIKIVGTVHERYPEPGNSSVLELWFPIAEGRPICQCCAMPLNNPEDFGTKADGSPNMDYCHYCYENGSFGEEKTMEEVIEICIPFCLEAGEYPDAETARAAMMAFFPKLKRWAK